MKPFFQITIITVTISYFASCVNAPNYNDVPEIEFIAFSKTELEQGSINNDSLTLIISFQDGDGDLGLRPETAERNLFLIDNRTDDIFNSFKTPVIPEEGVGNGVSGEMRILLFTTCCVFPDNIPPCESPDLYPNNELSFTVYITDRAGNESNRIVTPVINLLCN